MSRVSGNVPDNTMQKQYRELAALATEPLHPDLVDWVEQDGPLGAPMLRHPLVYDMFVSAMPGQANRVYLRKKELIAEAIEQSDWHSVVFHHERPYRLKALIDYVIGRYESGEPCRLPVDQDTLDLVAEVWVDCENIGQNIEDWRAMFGEGGGFWLGTADERAEFDALPDPVRAYRAGIDDGDWSWSTQRHTAEFFAQRFNDPPLPVVEADIPKSRCFGYLTRRGEAELLVRLEP